MAVTGEGWGVLRNCASRCLLTESVIVIPLHHRTTIAVNDHPHATQVVGEVIVRLITSFFQGGALARMTDSRQFEKSGGDWLESNWNAERGLSYDRNGNIKTLLRTSNGAPADNFVYSYTGNQLTSLANGASTHT